MILLRFTMAPTHMVKLRGIEVFLDSTPTTIKTIHVVFVVPEDCAGNCANEQVVHDSTSFGWGEEIKQWQLVFPNTDIENVVIEGSCRTSRQRADRWSITGEWSTSESIGASEGGAGGESTNGDSAPEESAYGQSQ